MKKVLSFVPGFRSGTLWKKIVSSIAHLFILIIIIGMISSQDEKAFQKSDVIASNLSDLLYFICLIFLPYILITDIFGIRSRLPLFRKKNYILHYSWHINIRCSYFYNICYR